MKETLAELLAAHQAVVRRRDHPELAAQFDWLLGTGELVSVLPGTYAPPHVVATPLGRAIAACRWAPDAVLTGRTAARLTYWPSLPAVTVDLAQVRRRPPISGFTFSERRINPELVARVGELRVTVPALTAVDLCTELGGDPIDVVLRSRRATLAGLHRALELSPGRIGNRRRRRLLLDSRDEPWSAAGRLAHRILHAARVRGWRSNYPVTIAGRRYYLDIVFPGDRLVVEIDGREFHDDPDSFERDRHRQNALVGAGWRVLRFTWRMLVDEPDRVVAAIVQERRRAA